MNTVQLTGFLAADPEMRYTPTGLAVTMFRIAVRRPMAKEGKPDVDFIGCVAWRKTAEVIANHCHKGSRIGVEGRIQTRDYVARDGSKRFVVEVLVNTMEFLERKENGAAPANRQNSAAPQAPGSSAAEHQNSPAYGGDAPLDVGEMLPDDVPF